MAAWRLAPVLWRRAVSFLLCPVLHFRHRHKTVVREGIYSCVYRFVNFNNVKSWKFRRCFVQSNKRTRITTRSAVGWRLLDYR